MIRQWFCFPVKASVISFIAALIAGLSLQTNGTQPIAVAAQLPPQTIGSPQRHVLYRLIDLGTFGGPASYINEAYNSVPALSNQGITVGASDTPIHIDPLSVCGGGGYSRGLDGNVPFVSHGFAARNGFVVDLGSLPPARVNCSNASAVNASGWIVGFAEDSEIDPLAGLKEQHAVLWRNGRILDLGTLGGHWSGATGINDRGQVIGGSTNQIPDPLSMLYFVIGGLTNGTQQRAFIWQNGVMRDLGTLGGPDAFAEYINERGQIAGFSYTNSTPNETTGIPTVHPFLWDDGKMTDLGSLGGTIAGLGSFDQIAGLNNQGDVIGLSTLKGDPGCPSACDNFVDPFLWTHGRMIDLFTQSVGGRPVIPYGIDDAHENVGVARIADTYEAYLWKEGNITPLGTMGYCFSEAHAINNHRLIVGETFRCNGTDGHAFVWKDGVATDLNQLIPANSNLELITAIAVNDRGEIAGVGVRPGVDHTQWVNVGHAFILEPLPEASISSSLVARPLQVHQRPTSAELTFFAARLHAHFHASRRVRPWLMH